jgi:hypothetical protein
MKVLGKYPVLPRPQFPNGRINVPLHKSGFTTAEITAVFIEATEKMPHDPTKGMRGYKIESPLEPMEPNAADALRDLMGERNLQKG